MLTEIIHIRFIGPTPITPTVPAPGITRRPVLMGAAARHTARMAGMRVARRITRRPAPMPGADQRGELMARPPPADPTTPRQAPGEEVTALRTATRAGGRALSDAAASGPVRHR